MGHLARTIALVGMMGAGKTSIGRRLATRMGVAFRDADHEIEVAAGCTVSDIFERYGESAFRDCERKVIERILQEPPHVLATGGGAFMDADTRMRLKEAALSIWIKAPVDILLTRVQRKDNRPLLRAGNPREVLEKLMALREPFYAQADVAFESEDGPHGDMVDRIIDALTDRGMWSEA
ncbi:MAG: shikimate kinase [Alphaproteobacteria bacterium]|nr:shikimate kinase [Alphaproteobacteria bacterium]